MVRDGINQDLNPTHENFQLKFAESMGLEPEDLTLNSIIFADNMPAGFENLTREEAIKWMSDYITNVMKMYEGKIDNYIVVNEPHPNDPLMMIIGEDYITIAYQVARKANLFARLIFNHTDNHGPEGKYTAYTINIGQQLLNTNLIDAIGVQGHLAYPLGRAPSESQILSILEQYPGVIELTEVDVNLTGIDSPNRFLEQAELYRRLISAALSTGRCDLINLYGAFPDENSWYELNQGQSDADSTPWASEQRPKPGFYGILNAFYSNL